MTDGTRTARTRFAQALSSEIAKANFSTEYLARRCRVTPDTIEKWKVGVALPNTWEWSDLRRVSREFWPLGSILDEAILEPPPCEEADEVAVERPLAVAEPDKPVIQGTANLDDSGPRSATSSPRVTPESRESRRTDDYVQFKCKISGGRIVTVWMPGSFGVEDVSRINRFLLTQID